MLNRYENGNKKFQGKTDGFVILTFVAARHCDHEMKNVVFPMFLLGLIASLSIMIPATYGECLGVVTTIQLALIVLLSVIEQRVAPSAGTGNQPLLFGFFVYSTIVCLFSFAETIFYLYWSDGNGTVRIPDFLKPLYRRIMPCPDAIESCNMCDTGVKRM